MIPGFKLLQILLVMISYRSFSLGFSFRTSCTKQERLFQTLLLPKKRHTSLSSTARQATSESSEVIPQKTIAEGTYSDEQILKKSRFIGIIQHCESWQDAQDFIASIRAEHPKSRHVCFGFVAGVNPVQERSSDDGEPSGTGGSPILGALNGEGLSDAVCAVVRYSGGIKLGAGGLIRAYGGTARLAIRSAETEILIPKSVFKVLSPGSFVGALYETTNKFGGVMGGESYDDTGNLMATVICKTEVLDDIKNALQDATRGEIQYLEEEGDN